MSHGNERWLGLSRWHVAMIVLILLGAASVVVEVFIPAETVLQHGRLDLILRNETTPTLNKISGIVDMNVSNSSFHHDAAASLCLLEHQETNTRLYGEWIQRNVPILVSVNKIQGEYHFLYFLRHMKDRALWMTSTQTTYYCINANKTEARIIPGNPKSPHDFNLVVVCPSLVEQVAIQRTRYKNNETTGIGGETYNVSTLIQCHSLKESPTTTLDPQSLQIGMCTSIRGATARNLVEPWIEYHRMLGVDHFWIYLNEEWNNLTHLPQDRPYITYVPFNFHADYYNIRSQFSYFQAAINNDCLYMSRELSLQWILTTDVDEYIHVTHSVAGQAEKPLLSFLTSHINVTTDMGSLDMSPIFYGRGENDTVAPSLLLDYTWRKEGDLSQYTGYFGRHKQIYRPWQVDYVEVHEAYVGQPQVPVQVDSQVYIQHYKTPENGPFRLKGGRLQHDNVLQQRFRDRLLKRLEITSSSMPA